MKRVNSNQQIEERVQEKIMNNPISIKEMNPNILKNILRSYFQFLIDKENKDIIYELVSSKPYAIAISVIKKFIKKYKFNIKSLMRLIRSDGYKRAFEYYLTFDISNWLERSKIIDIYSHQKCIEQLKEYCVLMNNFE